MGHGGRRPAPSIAGWRGSACSRCSSTGPCRRPARLVERDGQEVGEIRSGLGDRALAMLRLDRLQGDGQGGGLVAGSTRVLPETPAWMRLPEAKD